MTIATVAHRHPLLQLAADAPRWDGAACIGHACIGHGHLFFLDEFTGMTAVADTAEAKRICTEECPLLEQCRDWAIAQRIPFGVYGGLTAEERGTELRGYCRTCGEPLPAGSKARYCPAHRRAVRAEQNRRRP
jgi:WhiB family redox-sensing transcriptional regulator